MKVILENGVPVGFVLSKDECFAAAMQYATQKLTAKYGEVGFEVDSCDFYVDRGVVDGFSGFLMKDYSKIVRGEIEL